ncbi:DUF4846 domain-containing protein [Mucilaginibacter gynuensis]|uniref:DUF4846 domain-containing protein n=1 Tax=Mucilaginibacter gynuensis TaxID=1302236 RepID=A0ABP8GH45_9SPHI
MKTILALITLLYLPLANNTIADRFKAPSGYTVAKTESGSFAHWLQTLALKPAGTPAKTYKGDIARTDVYTAAIIDMSIGSRDLQQCADAVIRVRAEYLYSKQNHKGISFNFTSGFKCDWVHYANGYRYANERWVLKGKKDYGHDNFLRYLTLVFSYAGTLSLDKELKTVGNADQLQIGDVFIKGGSPGHCFIVLNVATNSQNKKVFLLAQSFMPAQNIQVLQDQHGPWFSLDKQANIPYGELVDKKYLKRF